VKGARVKDKVGIELKKSDGSLTGYTREHVSEVMRRRAGDMRKQADQLSELADNVEHILGDAEEILYNSFIARKFV
jgi:hypothetical protein